MMRMRSRRLSRSSISHVSASPITKIREKGTSYPLLPAIPRTCSHFPPENRFLPPPKHNHPHPYHKQPHIQKIPEFPSASAHAQRMRISSSLGVVPLPLVPRIRHRAPSLMLGKRRDILSEELGEFIREAVLGVAVVGCLVDEAIAAEGGITGRCHGIAAGSKDMAEVGFGVATGQSQEWRWSKSSRKDGESSQGRCMVLEGAKGLLSSRWKRSGAAIGARTTDQSALRKRLRTFHFIGQQHRPFICIIFIALVFVRMARQD